MLRVRRISHDDLEFLFELRNLPHIREASRTTTPITPEQHRDWFTRVVKPDSLTKVFIVSYEGLPLGMGSIRITSKKQILTGELSYALWQHYRKLGLGKEIVQKLTMQAGVLGCTEVIAEVKASNIASINCLVQAGFTARDQSELLLFTRKVGKSS